ncbi:hypothetical protein [Polynucleobacter asymbioticus]|uniref:hypothetical protein n=1 Tax=Polynucleobacter asymbioticus TaxID=576611 RepID=UPI0012DB2A47|nr:hypothetical protein [Polynucleobacter asymbioticus]
MINHAYFLNLNICAIGHSEIASFDFNQSDLVWIMSYSKSTLENNEMFRLLSLTGAKDFIYISSASVNVVNDTKCYRYPNAKFAAEFNAISILGARILRIGLIYTDLCTLPAGLTMATSIAMLSNYIGEISNGKPFNTSNLFTPTYRPFINIFEKYLYNLYGYLMNFFWFYPCMLRPIDYFLRSMNMKWYGYLFLSNKKYGL